MKNPFLLQLIGTFVLSILAATVAHNWPLGREAGIGRNLLRAIVTFAVPLPLGFIYWMIALKLAYGPGALFGTAHDRRHPSGMLTVFGLLWVPVATWVRQLRQSGER